MTSAAAAPTMPVSRSVRMRLVPPPRSARRPQIGREMPATTFTSVNPTAACERVKPSARTAGM